MKSLSIVSAAAMSLVLTLPVSAAETERAVAAKSSPTSQATSLKSSDSDSATVLEGGEHEIEMDVHVGK